MPVHFSFSRNEKAPASSKLKIASALQFHILFFLLPGFLLLQKLHLLRDRVLVIVLQVLPGLLQNRWSHLFCISPFCVILTVIFYFVGQIENKSYFLPNPTVQTRENSIKNKSCYLIWTYRKSVISDAQKIRGIWAKDA